MNTARRLEADLEVSDQMLIESCAREDVSALAVLYKRHAPFLMTIATRFSSSSCDAEDVLQNVFLEVWLHAKDYTPERGNVRAWLVMRTRTRAIDAYRRRSVKYGVAWLAPEQGATSTEPLSNLALRRAVASLPDEMQKLIGMAFIHGMTSGEIAIELGIPVGTVKSRMAKVTTCLRQILR